MYKPKCFGLISTDYEFEKRVSISYDSLQYDKESDIKVLVINEPPYTSPLSNFNLIREKANLFDLILTWNESLLDLPNARKFLFGCCWIKFDTFKIDKKKQVSFITSDKNSSSGHKLRQLIWSGLEDADDLNGFDILKHRSPPRLENKNSMYENAKYSIVVENCSENNYFSEKIVDCFASKTIPIYWGCKNIDEYFNTKGILSFSTLEELKDILDNLQEDYYDNLSDIIEENLETSKQYWDYHYRIKSFIEEFIGETK